LPDDVIEFPKEAISHRKCNFFLTVFILASGKDSFGKSLLKKWRQKRRKNNAGLRSGAEMRLCWFQWWGGSCGSCFSMLGLDAISHGV